MPIRDIVIAEYIGMFVVWLAVSVTYQALTRGAWWHTPEGRLMMADSVLFTWITGLLLAGIFLHDYPGRVFVNLVSLGLFIGTGVWRLRIIIRAQREKRRRLRADDVQSHAADRLRR